jgi:hypothetical protein
VRRKSRTHRLIQGRSFPIHGLCTITALPLVISTLAAQLRHRPSGAHQAPSGCLGSVSCSSR